MVYETNRFCRAIGASTTQGDGTAQSGLANLGCCQEAQVPALQRAEVASGIRQGWRRSLEGQTSTGTAGEVEPSAQDGLAQAFVARREVQRLFDRPVDLSANRAGDQASLWCGLSCRFDASFLGWVGFFLPEAAKTCGGTGRGGHRSLGGQGLAADKKNAARNRAHLIFLDESGFSLIPTVKRTWGLRGQTPTLHHAFKHHRKVSAIGALTISPGRRRLGQYLHLYRDTDICQEAVVVFLRDLLRHVRGSVIVIWDRWSVHRGRTVQAFLEQQGRVQVEWLPPYAPELNPEEYCWTTLKYHRLSNHGHFDVDALEDAVSHEYASICNDQSLLRSFVRASSLPIRLG